MESTSTSHNQEMADEHVSATTGTLTSGTPPETAATIPLDDIRRYQVIRKLGNGSHGIVMKARDMVTEGFVAIKFVFQQEHTSLQQFQTALDAFARENQEHVRLLDHEGIIKLIAWSQAPQIWTDLAGVQREVLFSVLELAENGEFFDYVVINYSIIRMPQQPPDFPFSTELTRHYFKQLIAAVEYMHSQNMVHRDLKMENLLLDSNFNLKINDFGFQRTTEGQTDGMILCQTSLGTQAYQAPETTLGSLIQNPQYDGKKVDIYNCGVILFCCSLRASPFYEYNKQGKIQDTKQLLWEINDDPSSANLYWNRYLRRRSDLLPANLKDLVVRMLRRNPANRPTIEEIKAHDYFTGTVPTQARITEEGNFRKLCLAQINHQQQVQQQEEAKQRQSRRQYRSFGGDSELGETNSSEASAKDIEDLLKDFKENSKIYIANIPNGLDTCKKSYIFKSNAKSRDDIYDFIKANALKIFGTEKITFTSERANQILNVVIKQGKEDFQILSMKFETKSNEEGPNYSIEVMKNWGDHFMFTDIADDIDLTLKSILV